MSWRRGSERGCTGRERRQRDYNQSGSWGQDGLALELVGPRYRIVIPPVLGAIAVMRHGVPIHRLPPGSAPPFSQASPDKRAAFLVGSTSCSVSGNSPPRSEE